MVGWWGMNFPGMNFTGLERIEISVLESRDFGRTFRGKFRTEYSPLLSLVGIGGWRSKKRNEFIRGEGRCIFSYEKDQDGDMR